MGSTASPCPPVATTPSPTSAKPRVSTSVTQCTTSAGTSGGVGGAKSARTPWGGQGEGRAVLDPHSPSPQPYIMPQPTGTPCRPHLAGPGVLVRPGSAGPGAARAALGVQQQLAAAALEGGLPKTEAGAAGTAGLGADDLAGGIWSAPPCIPPACPGVRGGEEARTVLEVNWCWGCRRLGGGEVKGAGAGCPPEPPSVWLSCPGAQPPESSLVPHAVAGSAERGGSGGDPIGRGPQSHHGGSKHPPADLLPPP